MIIEGESKGKLCILAKEVPEVLLRLYDKKNGKTKSLNLIVNVVMELRKKKAIDFVAYLCDGME